MPTPITSSFINNNYQHAFLLNSQSTYFKFEVQKNGSPLASCSFAPSYSIAPIPRTIPNGLDYSTLNGFAIGTVSGQIDGYYYTYGLDNESNRECFRLGYIFGGDLSVNQGQPLYFNKLIFSSSYAINEDLTNYPFNFVYPNPEEEFLIQPSTYIFDASDFNDGTLGFHEDFYTAIGTGPSGQIAAVRYNDFEIKTPTWDVVDSDYDIARFRFRVGVKANPDFPQNLYAGRLVVCMVQPRGGYSQEFNDPDSPYYAYYGNGVLNSAGPIPTTTYPFPGNYPDLTPFSFRPAGLAFNGGGQGGQPPVPVGSLYVPIIGEIAIIDNIEMGPGLSGSYASNEIVIDLTTSQYFANYANDSTDTSGVSSPPLGTRFFNLKSFGFVGRFSFLTDPPVAPPPPPSQAPELWLVSIDPNGGIIPVQKINDTPLTTGSNSFNKTIQLSSSNLQIENSRLGIAAKYFGFNVNSPYFDSLNVTSFNLTTTVDPQNNTPDEIILGSAFEENFTNNDWNALFGNAFTPRDSQYFMDVDYSDSSIIGSTLTPINFDAIIDGTAVKAPVQDYYYNLQRHVIPRYDGSKSNAPGFNSASNDDSGYGGEIVAGNPKPFVGYYTSKGGSTPEVMNKTIINLDYIIDENLEVQVPALSDFTYNNQIQLFERDQYLFLDPDKNSIPFPLAGSTKYKIYRSGEFATPVVYSQTGSITAPYLIPSMSFFNSLGEETTITNTSSPYIVNVYINQTGPNNTAFNDVTYPPEPNEVFSLYSRGVEDPDPYLPNQNVNPAYSASILGGTVGRIRLNQGLASKLNQNLLFKKVEGSGYYDTVDLFNIGPIYPEIANISEYEIRFNSDERLAFSILSVYQTDTYADIYVSVPANFEEIYGTFPIPITYGVEGSGGGNPPLRPNFLNALGGLVKQRFLIRRWVPRAGYIYLDVDAALGKGIVKPEFITKGIEDKVSLIIKDLTDKGLITSTP